MKRTHGRAGWTLIELLVVFAIIGVVVGIALPAVQKFRKAADEAQRLNWLDQRRHGVTGPDREQPIAVLFIGNSLTQNGDADLPQMLSSLAKDSKKSPGLIVDVVAEGGQTLLGHWQKGIALEKLRSRKWDFVVLQEQSATPYFPELQQNFYDGSRMWGKEIRAHGAIPLFYMTWPRDTNPLNQHLLTKPYVFVASEKGDEVCPAGMAMASCKLGSPSFSLYPAGDYHPTTTGMYLISCTFFGWIYDVDPRGLPPTATVNGRQVVNLSASQALELQTYAHQANQDVKKLMRQQSWKE
jgi:prepilin-type N-terminal cleavage/methylation domain-containing protein